MIRLIIVSLGESAVKVYDKRQRSASGREQKPLAYPQIAYRNLLKPSPVPTVLNVHGQNGTVKYGHGHPPTILARGTDANAPHPH